MKDTEADITLQYRESPVKKVKVEPEEPVLYNPMEEEEEVKSLNDSSGEFNYWVFIYIKI